MIFLRRFPVQLSTFSASASIHQKPHIGHQLNRLAECVAAVRPIRSRNERISLVQTKFKDCNKLLNLIYDPHKPFHIRSSRLVQFTNMRPVDSSLAESLTDDLGDLLHQLSERRLTGMAALDTLAALCDLFPAHKDLLYKIIDKNLKIQLSFSAFSDTKQESQQANRRFKVTLAKSMDDKRRAQVLEDLDQWYCMRKWDGVRCLVLLDPKTKSVEFWSRQGRPLSNLDSLSVLLRDKVLEQLESAVVLDGELCSLNIGNVVHDNFLETMSFVSSRTAHSSSPTLVPFDLVKVDEFYDGRAPKLWIDRYNDLYQCLHKAGLVEKDFAEHLGEGLENNSSKDQIIRLCKIVSIKSGEELQSMEEHAVANNWEGLMVRKNALYHATRSDTLLKIKQYQDAEYTIEGFEVGSMTFTREGERVEESVLASVIVNHRGLNNDQYHIALKNTGNQVKVGSGLSLEERVKYSRNPEQLVGTKATVRYFQETETSLRFPVLKYLWLKQGRDI